MRPTFRQRIAVVDAGTRSLYEWRCDEHPAGKPLESAPRKGTEKNPEGADPSQGARRRKRRWSKQQKRERKKWNAQKEAFSQKKVVSLGELDWLRVQAKLALPKDPRLTLAMCARALEEEQRLAARVGEERAATVMDGFRRLRSQARASLSS